MSFKKLSIFALTITILIFIFTLISFAATYGDFTYTASSKSVKITAYNGTDEVVKVPESVDGKTVKTIGKGAFYDTAVKVVYLPETVTKTEEGAFSSGVSVIFSDNGTTYESSHCYDEGTVIRQATCTQTGEKLYTCIICGETKTEEIPKTSHTWSSAKIVSNASCTQGTTLSYTCSVCGDENVEILDDLLPHTYSYACDSTCNICGAERDVSHNPGTILYNETSHYSYCTYCALKINSSAHTSVKKDGAEVCSVCGYIIKPASNHTHKLTEISAKAPTCTEEGNTKYYKCSGCSSVFSDPDGKNQTSLTSVIIAPTGHTPIEISAKSATTTSEGSTLGYKCSVCGDILCAPETINKITSSPPSDTEFVAIETTPETTDNSISESEEAHEETEIDDTALVEDSSQQKSDFPLIPIITAGVVIAAVVAIIIFKKKK